ncbi:glycosyltransferase family 2 protein [Candidatus Nitrospira bockiana]
MSIGRPQPQPLVSVVIPTHNHGRYIGEAIASVQAQANSRCEIVVVDDGSTDHTADVLAGCSGVRYIRQANRGPAAARNRGLAASRGDYVVFLDADDRVLPGHFETCLDGFRRRPEVGWVCGDFRLLGPDSTWRHVHCCDPLPDHYGSLLRVNFIGSIHAVMFKRQVLVEAGGFDPRLQACEDYDLYLRLARRTPLYCHHEVIAEYRRKAHQLSRQWDVMLKWGMHVLRAQRPHLRAQAAYRDAYREGLARCRTRYGELALWQMVALARRGEWRRAGRFLAVLAACYPQGLAAVIEGKITRRLTRLLRQRPT